MSYWKYENKLISSTRRPWSSIFQCSLENIIYIVICYPLTFICCRLALKLKGLKVCGKTLETCYNPGVCSEKFKEFLRAVTVPKNFGSGWSNNISVRFRFSVRVFILWNPNLIHLNLLILPIFIPFFVNESIVSKMSHWWAWINRILHLWHIMHTYTVII